MRKVAQVRENLGADVSAGEVWSQVHFTGNPGIGMISLSCYTLKQSLSQFLTLMSKSLVTGSLGGSRET